MVLNRLEHIIASQELRDKQVLVTGCGYKPLKKTFYDIVTNEPTHDEIEVDGQLMKLNIGSAIAGVLARKGANVHLISRSPDKLQAIQEQLGQYVNENLIEYTALDLLSPADVATFAQTLPTDKQIYWVQSVGLGAGSYNLQDDNPYLSLDNISLDLLEAEATTVLKSTHNLMQAFLPRFETQKETRIAIISSMSAIRSYPYGGTHCAAKGAIDRYANAAMLELYKKNIFLSTIRPGGVDTGMYDGIPAQEAVKHISDQYNGIYREHFALAPPTSIGEIVGTVFTVPAHIPSVNLVAKGQFPNEGS